MVKNYSQFLVFALLTISIFVLFNHQDHFNDEINANKKFYPSEYDFVKRTFPYFDYDLDAYKDSYKELAKLKKEKKLSKSSSSNLDKNWEFLGPTNIGGRVVDIEFDPKNSNIVYAAAATGGVFKSTDRGNNWFPIFDDQPILTIGDIAVDPNDSDIIYVGSGEANGGHNNFPGNGIYKSIDAGNTWQHIGLDSTVSIGRIIIDPRNSQKIFVAAVGSYFKPNKDRGVYVSTNGGETWQQSLFVSDSTGAIDLVYNYDNPDIIFAAMWERVRLPEFRSQTHLYGPTGGIYKSINSGNSWQKLGTLNGLPDETTEKIGRIGLSISESNPSTIYALYNDGTNITGLYKSVNNGDNWNLITENFSGDGSFSWYFGQLRVHPQNPNILFVLDVSMMKSTSSGLAWDFSYGYGGPNQLHVDHHALAFDPKDPNYILSGNDGGINISTDGGITWSDPVKLPITQFYEIGLDAQNPSYFYGGTQDNNTIKTRNSNIENWERILGGDGFYVLVNPLDSNIVYAESQFGGLAKSINGGNTFGYALSGIDSNEPTNWSTPIAMNPKNPRTLYYGTHSLYRTIDEAENWEKISPQLTNYDETRRIGTITTICVSPLDSNIIYVGSDDGSIWISKNNGKNWNYLANNLPLRWVTRIVADPIDTNEVYVTYSGLRWAEKEAKVFKSKDYGESWIDISSNLPDAPVNAFAIDPKNPNYIYLGSDIGAFYSSDEGSNWQILGNNLPIVVVNDMKISADASSLVIGTHGRGMYKLDISDIVADVSNNTLANNFSLSQNYPNPFNPTTTINYTIPNVASDFSLRNVSLKIYDVLGREIKTLVNKKQTGGTYSIQFDGSDFSSGIYFYKLSYGEFSQTKKMLLLK